MEETKNWWQSKGVLGGIVSLIALVVGAFGYSVSPEDQAAVVAVMAVLVSAGGTLVGIIGRVKATKIIGKPS
jgi:hypothetical protein